MRSRPAAIVILLITIAVSNAFADGKWAGVDETVVERIAEEHGRAASSPVIDTDKGDLLLFVFLLAGAAGGFAGGYFFRMLIEKKPGNAGETAATGS